MAFLPYIEKFFDSGASFTTALSKELQHEEPDLKKFQGKALNSEINNLFIDSYKRIFKEQHTLMSPADNNSTQHYICMSQYFYDALMNAIKKTVGREKEAEFKKRAKNKLFFCYKKVPGNVFAFDLGCSRIDDKKKVVTRHFTDEVDEIFILVRDVMIKFILKEESFFDEFLQNQSSVFFEDDESVKIFFPLIYERIGSPKNKHVLLLQKNGDSFTELFTYPPEERSTYVDYPENMFAIVKDTPEKNKQYFSRNNTNPLFLTGIENFYIQNKEFEEMLITLGNQKDVTLEGRSFLKSIRRGNHMIYSVTLNFLKKNFFGNEQDEFEQSGLTDFDIAGFISEFNDSVKKLHAKLGKFKLIDIGADGSCGWNSIIYCIFEEKTGENFERLRRNLLKTYITIRQKKYSKKLLQPDLPIKKHSSPEYEFQKISKNFHEPLSDGGDINISWEDHTLYLGLFKHPWASYTDIQNILACLGVSYVSSSGGNQPGFEYRNTNFEREDLDLEKMVTISSSSDDEYDWAFKIINTGNHWEVLEKNDSKRIKEARQYLQTAFEALFQDPSRYRLPEDTFGKFLTTPCSVVTESQRVY